MKIKPEHFNHLKTTIEDFLKENPNLINKYETGHFLRRTKFASLQTRFNFDVLHLSGLTPFVCNTLYSYMNDDHLKNALKKICPKVERKF